MEVDILTIFPGMFSGVMSESILGRAQSKGILTVRVHDNRDFALGKHRNTHHQGKKRNERGACVMGIHGIMGRSTKLPKTKPLTFINGVQRVEPTFGRAPSHTQ